MACPAAVVYVPVAGEYVLSPFPSSATYSVVGLANHIPNGNEVADFSAVGNPCRMHMLLGRPSLCSVAGS